LNDIEFEDDPTDYTQNDIFDIIVRGKRWDVKTCHFFGVPYQVNTTVKKHPVEFYCFLQGTAYNIDGAITSGGIRPLGLISYANFWKYSRHVPCGEQIPGKAIVQSYRNGSNILCDTSHIKPFPHGKSSQQALDILRTIATQKPRRT
jgi:hypothetical protein